MVIPNKKLYKIAVSYIDDLAKEFQNEKNEINISEIEDSAFSKYEDDDYIQDFSDILDDSKQPGFIGVGIEDKDNIQGYIYGYQFIYEDNWEDYMEELPITAKALHYFTIKKLKKAAKSGKIFYIANLAINENYKILLDRVLKRFVDKIKQAGYNYIVANLLSDSARLLTNNSGKVNEDRIVRYGLKLISFGDIENDDSKIIVLECK